MEIKFQELLLKENKNRQEQIQLIEMIAERIKLGKLDYLFAFFELVMNFKTNKEELASFFWEEYSTGNYLNSDEPLRYIAIHTFRRYETFKQKDQLSDLHLEDLTDSDIPSNSDIYSSIFIEQVIALLPEDMQERMRQHVYNGIPLTQLFTRTEINKIKKLRKYLKDF